MELMAQRRDLFDTIACLAAQTSFIDGTTHTWLPTLTKSNTIHTCRDALVELLMCPLSIGPLFPRAKGDSMAQAPAGRGRNHLESGRRLGRATGPREGGICFDRLEPEMAFRHPGLFHCGSIAGNRSEIWGCSGGLGHRCETRLSVALTIQDATKSKIPDASH